MLSDDESAFLRGMSGGFLMEFFCYAYGRLSKEDLELMPKGDKIARLLRL